MDDRQAFPGAVIELATVDQLRELLAFAALSGDAPHWPAAAWLSFLHPPEADAAIRRQLFTFRERGDIAGLVAVAVLSDTTELELLLVRPSSRRKGVGQVLTAHWLQWAKSAGVGKAVLEVRASNAAAQALYRKLGFRTQGVRPRYYNDPPEDALLMHCSMTGEAAGAPTATPDETGWGRP